jgi:hypothetical protein
MKAFKPGLSALVVFAGLVGSAQAQGLAGGYAAYPGGGSNAGYYSINGGFGNYGLPGSNPNYRGYGLSGYGPGSNLNGYFTASPNPYGGRVQNNMGGLMNTIQQQTGKRGGYRNNSSYGVSQPRPVR